MNWKFWQKKTVRRFDGPVKDGAVFRCPECVIQSSNQNDADNLWCGLCEKFVDHNELEEPGSIIRIPGADADLEPTDGSTVTYIKRDREGLMMEGSMSQAERDRQLALWMRDLMRGDL